MSPGDILTNRRVPFASCTKSATMAFSFVPGRLGSLRIRTADTGRSGIVFIGSPQKGIARKSK
jgi:hypothetical protein